MNARWFRVSTSLVYGFATAEIPGGFPGGVAFKEVAHKSLKSLAKSLNDQEFALVSTTDPELYDEIAIAAKGALGVDCPACISNFLVNDSRPTGIPGLWRSTGGGYFLHPIAADGGAQPTVAYSRVKSAKAKRDLWCSASLLVYEL